MEHRRQLIESNMTAMQSGMEALANEQQAGMDSLNQMSTPPRSPANQLAASQQSPTNRRAASQRSPTNQLAASSRSPNRSPGIQHQNRPPQFQPDDSSHNMPHYGAGNHPIIHHHHDNYQVANQQPDAYHQYNSQTVSYQQQRPGIYSLGDAQSATLPTRSEFYNAHTSVPRTMPTPDLHGSVALQPDRLSRVREYQQRLLNSSTDRSRSLEINRIDLERQTEDLMEKYHVLKARSSRNQGSQHNHEHVAPGYYKASREGETHEAQSDGTDDWISTEGSTHPLQGVNSDDWMRTEGSKHPLQGVTSDDWMRTQLVGQMTDLGDGGIGSIITQQQEGRSDFTEQAPSMSMHFTNQYQSVEASAPFTDVPDSGWASKFADFVENDRAEHEAQADEERRAFAKKKEDLQAQLEEVRRQKKELENRHNLHSDDMDILRQKWRAELEQFRVYDSHNEESEDADSQGSDHQVVLDDVDTNHQMALDDVDTNHQVELAENGTDHQYGPDEDLDDALLRELAEVNLNIGQTAGLTSIGLQSRTKPPPLQYCGLDQARPHLHQLSPIIEMDTPASDKLPQKFKVKGHRLSTSPIGEEPDEPLQAEATEPKSRRSLLFAASEGKGESGEDVRLSTLHSGFDTVSGRPLQTTMGGTYQKPLGGSTEPSPPNYQSFGTASISTGNLKHSNLNLLCSNMQENI